MKRTRHKPEQIIKKLRDADGMLAAGRTIGDPALETILSFVSIDEAAHFGLFRELFELFLKLDRDLAVAALRPVLNQFQMPAIHDLLDESQRRIANVRDLGLFNEEIFFATSMDSS